MVTHTNVFPEPTSISFRYLHNVVNKKRDPLVITYPVPNFGSPRFLVSFTQGSRKVTLGSHNIKTCTDVINLSIKNDYVKTGTSRVSSFLPSIPQVRFFHQIVYEIIRTFLLETVPI